MELDVFMKENQKYRDSFRTFGVRILLWILLFLPLQMWANGWTPTTGGLVVNLKPGDKILISVMVDHDDNPATPDREYFVGNYSRYTGDDYFKYDSLSQFIRLMQQDARATEPSEMTIWTVDTALTRVDKGGVVAKNRDFSLGGISYTIWNDDKTVKTASDRWRFYGDLESNPENDRLCDVVFVIPTERSTITSFDPNKTLNAKYGRSQDEDGRFNGQTGTGFLGMTYREVYWLEIPRFNGPVTYTNAALVTFNTTKNKIKWTAIGQDVASGRAGYVYEDHTNNKPHHLTQRTIFRLYILNDPFNTCPDSYFFAYNEQNTLKYRKTNNVPGTASDSTAKQKIYTEDRIFPMSRVDETQYYQTGYMNVPVSDSAFYYVGWHDDYRNGSGAESPLSPEPLGSSTSKSQFTQIRSLPMNSLSGFNAPAGAYGRMVADTTSSNDNINVKFDPAGYFLKVSTGKNVRMRQVNANTWITEEMWTITDAWAALSIKATLMTGSEFSESDPGADIVGWSKRIIGTYVPVYNSSDPVTGKSGYARITTNSTDSNGHLEFVLADRTKHIHYDNNGFLGVQLPDQYPLSGATTMTVMSPRLKRGYTFTGWNTAADGTGVAFAANQELTISSLTWIGDTVINLYAQGTYDGTYNVAMSFINPTDNKRYFMTHPGAAAPRYSRARHYEDWTNVWQGMENADNVNPLYLNSFELRHPSNEVKAYQAEIPVANRHLEPGEFVLDPRQYTMKGGVDSITFYENFKPAKDEYLGLYYGTGLNTILANTTWAGLFRSTSTATSTGWPDYRLPYIHSTKLYSERYVEEEDSENHPDSLTLKIRGNNSEGTYVKYMPATNQFDGVVSEGDATEFQITAIVVADEQFVVLPDTTVDWRDTIVFDDFTTPHPSKQVQSKLIGKQLMACMMVDRDTTYFHPNRDKILTTENALRLSSDFRLTQSVTFIPDTRFAGVDEEYRPSMEKEDEFTYNLIGGHGNPIVNAPYQGNYIDMEDTLRIALTQGAVSKIKNYYGRWKTNAPGLHVSGATRYRDVIVRTKTYHYGPTTTRLVLTPEYDSYTFNPLAEKSRQINFTLTKVTSRSLLDKDGNEVDVEIFSSDDITSSLALGPSACSFRTEGIFTVSEAVSQHATLATRAVNSEGDNLDTLIVSTTVRIDGFDYSATARVPLIQTSLAGDELIWSVQSGSQRYYIMAGTGGLIFRQYNKKNAILYQNGTTTALKKGSANATNSDTKYITPWRYRYNPDNTEQLSLKMEYGVDHYLKMSGETVGAEAGIHASDSSLFTFHYVNVYTNSNANEEEQVKLQYGADKWLQFKPTSGGVLKLVDDEDSASVFSWSFLKQEYSLLNNGTYPSRKSVTFGYNTNMSVDIQTRYKAYKEYSMLVGNEVLYLCREDENDIADLINGELEWKTEYDIELIQDARDFEGDSDPVSGLSRTFNTTTLTNTISTSGATTSPTDVKIGGKYVNIVDTLHVTLGLQTGAPEYSFKGDWSSFSSLDDAELKIPLIRTTYHVAEYDSLACVEANEEYEHIFPNTITDPVSYVFELSTKRRTGEHVLDVDNNTVAVQSVEETDLTSQMALNNKLLAEARLIDAFGNTPSWCHIKTIGAHTIEVECTESGLRSPRTAYIYIAYIVMVDHDGNDATPAQTRFVNYRLTVSQPSLFVYANNQHLVHSRGASGDPLDAKGMQQVHENKRILYYYPEQDVELPVRESHFFGWWRWFREGAEGIGDTDIPEEVWRQKPQNAAGTYNFPFRIIGDSVLNDKADPSKGKKLVTMGRYTVFHYKSSQYPDWRKTPPIKIVKVAPPVTTFGAAEKPTFTYAVDISNYYDKLPMSVSQKNQVDTARLDTMQAIPEPTLSLREVFELHPWTEMAERMESYKSERTDNDAGDYILANENYMEDHVVMAPLGNQLLLSTEQRYNLANLAKNGHSESLLGYYMRDDKWSTWSADLERQDTMIWCGGWDADCEWYTYNPKTKKYTKSNNKITDGDDFLVIPEKTNITQGQNFDTVYYCLRARSWKTLADRFGKDSTIGGDYMFNICRYMVIYHRPDKYGPLEENARGKALITNAEIEQNYEILEQLNFDYNKPGNDYTVYPHPLPWADASYGYTYPETPDLPHNRPHSQSDLPNFGEYGLINRVHYTDYWYDMQQHGGAANGYMIYCDGMSSAGQVAALSLTTQLCQGQKMYFSGYVGNVSSQTGKSNPNFTISVQGSTDGSVWHDITSYMTGDIKPSQKWYQIYFPITLDKDQEDYTHFRVRIYNVASNWDGNDFVIDDLCIFATKPPLVAYQAKTTCSEGINDSLTHVVLRVDYQGFVNPEAYNGHPIYYTIDQETANGELLNFIEPEDEYLNNVVVPYSGSGDSPSIPGDFESGPDVGASSLPMPTTDTIYGYIPMPAKDHVTADPDSVFPNLTALIEKFQNTYEANPATVFRQGYIYEEVDGVIRPVMYIVHLAKMTPNNNYKVRMVVDDYKDLMSSICAMTSNLKVSNRMVLEINGEEQPEREVVGMCSNNTYDISLRAKGSLFLDGVSPIDLNGACKCDWLLYGDTAEASSYRRYGYYYSDIKKVITQILRYETQTGKANANQFASNLGAINRRELVRVKSESGVVLSSGSVNPYNLIRDLVNNGFLTLYQSNIQATVASGDSIQYIIMPIVGTGSDVLHNANVEVCPIPILIKLKPDDSANPAPLILGGLHRDSTQAKLPPVVLLTEQAANEEIAIRVDSLRTGLALDSIYVISTDDPDYVEGLHQLQLSPDREYDFDGGSNDDYYVKGDSIRLRPYNASTYHMRAGYTYTFVVTMQTNTRAKTIGDCRVGIVPFTVSIVPNYVRWNPQSEESNQWNNPDNWVGVNEHNQVIHADAHFAPLASTNVIIPAMTNGMPYPEMPDLSNKESYDSVKQVGFAYNKCNTIRLMSGAAMSQQQRMEYTKAVVDMPLPNGQWSFRSAPVMGMISGDLFMANADIEEETSPWEVGEFDAYGRNYRTGNSSYWLSLYSTSTTRKGNGSTSTDTARAADAEWSKVTNAMTLSLPPAQGWAVYTRTKSGGNAAVRLPKNDDIYYYYYSNGNKAEDLYEHNLRTERETNATSAVAGSHAGELAFHPDDTSQDYTLTKGVGSNTFIFGNPTMGYIDIWGFIADNSLEEEIGYMASNNVYTTVSKETAEADNETDIITNQQRYLPPMHAMLVTVSEGTPTELTVTVNANRVLTSPAKKVRAAAPARMVSHKYPKGIMTVTATNTVSPRCFSRLLIGQGYQDGIYAGEDAVLTTLNIDNYTNNTTPATPFNLYAVQGGYGLCIDLLDSVVYVPLSFNLSNLPFDPVTHLWFTGVNAIEGPLVLYDALLGTERPIIDGICLDIETPEMSHQMRYYIRRPGYVPQSQNDNPIATGFETETVNETPRAQKIYYQGHVYILRDGHVYTIFGQQIR